MKKFFYFLSVAIVSTAFLSSCSKDDDAPDITPPDAPVITAENNKIKADATNISGTGEKGAFLTIYVNDQISSSMVTTVDGNGNWTITPITIAEGQKIYAKQTDAAGNESEKSNEVTIIAANADPGDTTAPAKPTLTDITDNQIRSDATTITGGADEAGITAILYVNNVEKTTVTVTPGKTWTFTFSSITPSITLQPGNKIYVKLRDAAGNESVKSDEITVVSPIVGTWKKTEAKMHYTNQIGANPNSINISWEASLTFTKDNKVTQDLTAGETIYEGTYTLSGNTLTITYTQKKIRQPNLQYQPDLTFLSPEVQKFTLTYTGNNKSSIELNMAKTDVSAQFSPNIISGQHYNAYFVLKANRQ